MFACFILSNQRDVKWRRLDRGSDGRHQDVEDFCSIRGLATSLQTDHDIDQDRKAMLAPAIES